MAILTFVSGDTPIDRYIVPDLGVVNAAGTLVTGGGGGGVLNATAATLQVSSDGVTWAAMLRGDTGAAITALTASNVPVSLNWRFIRCTAGSATIRPFTTT